MTNSSQVDVKFLEQRLETLRNYETSSLKSGGGGGTLDSMERIAKLETRADFAEQRLTRIEDKLDRVLEKMGALPTTNGLWGMVATVVGVGIAIAGLTFAVASYVAQ